MKQHKYDVVFTCSKAGYYWTSVNDLTLEEAWKVFHQKNKYEKIHGDCCQYYVQKKS